MNNKFTAGSIRSGAAYVYIETTVSLFLGYVFWILMSKIATAEIIGTSSAIISLAGILAVVANLGIPTGVQRFLGRSFASASSKETQGYFFASFFLLSFSSFLVTLGVLQLSGYILAFFQIKSEFLVICILLMISIIYATFFRGIVISSLKTKILTVSISLSALIKIVLGVILILNGYGTFGLVLSFTLNQCIVSAILAVTLIPVFRTSINFADFQNNIKSRVYGFARNIKEVFESSLANWIPLVITTIGTQVGTIFVYGIKGAVDAGLFFMALTIVTGITSVMYSLFTISLPAMSAMSDERRSFTTYTIRLSLLIAIPLSFSILFYSAEILGLLGHEYIDASLMLEVLILSLLPTAIQYGITSVAYSYGKYKQVLLLGLAISIPRVVLYFTLVPLWGGLGGALAYTIGSITGFLVSIFIAKQNITKLEWRNYVLIFSLPILFGYIFHSLNINFILGMMCIVVMSYSAFYALKILTRNEVNLVLKNIPYLRRLNSHNANDRKK